MACWRSSRINVLKLESTSLPDGFINTPTRLSDLPDSSYNELSICPFIVHI